MVGPRGERRTHLEGGDEAGFACVVVGQRGERRTYLEGGDEAGFACVVVGQRGARRSCADLVSPFVLQGEPARVQTQSNNQLVAWGPKPQPVLSRPFLVTNTLIKDVA